MCADMCIDMHIDTCIDTCIDMGSFCDSRSNVLFVSVREGIGG